MHQLIPLIGLFLEMDEDERHVAFEPRMDEDERHIVFEPSEDRLDGSTNVYQVEDGTLFYYDGYELYVESRGRHLRLDLPIILASRFEVRGLGACGNAMYFEANRKIHKVTFDQKTDTFEIQLIRELLLGEKVLENAITIRERNGKEFAFRMSWDLDAQGVEVEDGRDVIGVIGNRIFYRTERAHNWLCKSAADSYLIEIRERNSRLESHHARNVRVYAPNDASAEVYVTNGEHLAVIRDGAVEMLKFTGPEEIRSIIGVHKGVIKVLGMDEGKKIMCSARLHDLELLAARRASSRQSEEFFEDMMGRNEKLQADLNASIVSHALQIQSMQSTIDHLREENVQMKQRMEGMEEMLAQVHIQILSRTDDANNNE